jgi:hypothetical protein
VVSVGNGTVSVVLPTSVVALACPNNAPSRTKFATGRPKPLSAKRWPSIVKIAG